MSNLAQAYHGLGEMDKALPLFEKTLKLRKAKLGPEHPDTLVSMSALAMAYKSVGKQGSAALRGDVSALQGQVWPPTSQHAHQHGHPGRRV